MNLRDLAKLKELREMREMRAREALASENDSLRQREAAAAAAVARVKAEEATTRERNRAAMAELLLDRATPLRFARMELQYRIGQEALLGSLRAATSENRAAAEQRARAEAARTEWSTAAKTLRKIELLIDTQNAAPPRDPDDTTD